ISICAPLEKFKNKVRVSGGALKPFEITVPGDISSAAFFMAAASIIKGSRIEIAGVGVNPTRAGILKVLESMGAHIEIKNAAGFELGEPAADIIVESSELSGIKVPPDLIPEMIDELPVLAVAATQAEGETVVTGASELRVKETDRIKATVGQLKRMGADIEELPDGFVVRGPVSLKGAEVESFKDHRMAMSLAVAGITAEGETIIADAECVDISFPGFWEILERL
ncbi:MAG: 3-phosphoshikimate 1-carboxyvinyltransferase, partial [Firmicutes bacterium]|nr:3-phosphoshikimate 1-carboxyvinyltransferase [Bacillota bacterium]